MSRPDIGVGRIGDLPYDLQQQTRIALDLVRNAIRLGLDANVHAIQIANVLISEAGMIVAHLPEPLRGRCCAAFEANFKGVVAGHVTLQEEGR